jgi:hypothetical protein
MLPPGRTVDGKTQLRAPSLQEGELLDLCTVLPLRCFPCPMLHRKVILKKGNLRVRPSVSSRVEASTVVFSALDAHSNASLSAKVAPSSASLT